MIALQRDNLEKQEILQKIAKRFGKGEEYPETEVNEIIKSFDVDDFALIRRELVNFNYLGKDSYKGVYWVKKHELPKEEKDKIKSTQGKIKQIN